MVLTELRWGQEIILQSGVLCPNILEAAIALLTKSPNIYAQDCGVAKGATCCARGPGDACLTRVTQTHVPCDARVQTHA